MAKLSRIVISVSFLAALVSLAISGYDKTAVDQALSNKALYDALGNFGEAIDILRDEYVEPVDPDKLLHGAVRGMLSSLDEYSQFLEKSEYEELESDSKGEFGGIGIEISIKNGVVTVISPIDGSPAEAAGIKPGDKIVKIDGKATDSMAINDAVGMLRGNPGTMVTLTIWREDTDKVIDIPMRRAIVKIASIKKSEILHGDIGYIKIAEFQENTSGDIDIELKRLEGLGMKSLVLDLRNNPGGLLETAFDVAERFVPKDSTIVSIKSRVPEDSIVFKSSGDFTRPLYPVVVIVNGGSASASEVVAGAIQDNKRGTILGTRTFGKAAVQEVVPLSDGSAIKFTTGYYYTPNGRLITKEGIAPDMVVEDDPKQSPEPGNKVDMQLAAAIRILKSGSKSE